MIDHRREPGRGDVAFRLAVDGVAHCHVVCGNRLCHESRGAGCAEETVCRFLPRADFGKSAVNQRIEVQLQGLVVGARNHGVSPSSQSSATKRSISTWLADLALTGNFKETIT